MPIELGLILPDTVCHENVTLPARHLRFCGAEFRDDGRFLASAQAEADRLVDHFGLTTNSGVLDAGCGVGRLPIGILRRLGDIRHYRGVDVSRISIEWCQRHISRLHPGFQFFHINVRNLRYNPGGRAVDIGFQLPFEDQEFEIIYLYSVFSHMTKDDVRVYLKEFRRLLAPSGKVFLTAFVEEDVPDMSINPSGYRMRWTGPLHCVRYSRGLFETMLFEEGFGIDYFQYGSETGGQSAICVSRREIVAPGV